MEWSELISKNRMHLSYLGDKLKVKYDDVNEIFQREYSELMIPNRNPRLYESKKTEINIGTGPPSPAGAGLQ